MLNTPTYTWMIKYMLITYTFVITFWYIVCVILLCLSILAQLRSEFKQFYCIYFVCGMGISPFPPIWLLEINQRLL